MYLYVATWQSKVTEYGRESCLDDYGKISVYRHVNGRTASTLCIQIFKRYLKRRISTTGILKAQLICACRPSCLSTSRACVAVGPALCCQWAWLMLLRDQDSMWLKDWRSTELYHVRRRTEENRLPKERRRETTGLQVCAKRVHWCWQGENIRCNYWKGGGN